MYSLWMNSFLFFLCTALGLSTPSSPSHPAGILSFRLRYIKDNFGLLRDIHANFILWVITFFFAVFVRPIIAISSSSIRSDEFEIADSVMDFLIAGTMTISFGITAIRPLLATYSSPSRFKSFRESAPDVPSFTTVMSDPNLLDRFRAFLQSEFSVENLIFVEEVDRISNLRPMAKLARMRTLQQICVDVGSPMEVNVSFVSRNQFIAEMERIPQADVDDAVLSGAVEALQQLRGEIMKLLETDLYFRYKSVLGAELRFQKCFSVANPPGPTPSRSLYC
jgi:hypothetical protein